MNATAYVNMSHFNDAPAAKAPSGTEYSLGFYQKLLGVAHLTLSASAFGTLLTIILGYVVHDHMSFAVQLGSHIGLIIAVTGIKFGYIARCVALQGLGNRQL